MNRKEFLQSASASLGACLCGGAVLAQTAGSPPAPETPELRELKGKVSFMQTRMARLLESLDEPTRLRVLETMGRACAREFAPMLEKFRGKPEEFLAEEKRQWMKQADFDAAAGTLRVVDRSPACTCAFVKKGLTPADFCACTLGWQKEAYAIILNEPVDAELESSILRGGTACIFRMKVARRA